MIVLQSPQYAIYANADSTYAGFFLAYVRICVNLIITVKTYSYANFMWTRFFSKDQNACKSENRYAWKKGQRLPLH